MSVCKNCGNNCPDNPSRCNTCGMYSIEDPKVFNTYSQKTKMAGLIKHEVKKDPVKTSKGEYDGDCNRTACDKKQAKWYNHSTRAYYCGKCAMQINAYAPEYKAEVGHELCVYEETRQIH